MSIARTVAVGGHPPTPGWLRSCPSSHWPCGYRCGMGPRDEHVRTGRRWVPALVGLCVMVAASACTAAGSAEEQPSVATADAGSATTTDPATPVSPEDPTSEAAASPEAAVATGLPANATALDFSARRLDGGTIDGVQLAGGPVVLWMWAPWCPQCNREAKHVAEALQRHGGEITFVGMAGHDTEDAHRAFVDEHGLDAMLHVVDEDGSLWSQYGINYQPAWVFIDEDGVTEVVAGGLYDDLEPRLQALLDR